MRAYAGDLSSLFEHAARMKCEDVDEVTIGVLRSWLARLHSQGASRATLARRASSARVFTAWAVRDGVLTSDPGALLASPKGRRSLPEVLRIDQAAAVMDGGRRGRSARSGCATPRSSRLLYATGARVSELCGLDIDELDTARRTVRLMGKGAKERPSCLWSMPAAPGDRGCLAGDSGPSGACRCQTVRQSVRRCCSARAVASARPASGTTGWCTSGSAAVDGHGRLGPAWAASYRGDTSYWRAARTLRKRSGTTRSRYARHYADLHTRVNRATEGNV